MLFKYRSLEEERRICYSFRNCVLVILGVCLLVLLFLAIYILPTNQDRMKAWEKIVTNKWGQ